MEAGELVEVWEATGGRLQPRHLLVLPQRWAEHVWGDIIEVRGRPDVIEWLQKL